MTGVPRPVLAAVLLGIALAVPAAQKSTKPSQQQQKQQELKATRQRIEQLEKQTARTTAEREQAMKQLRDVERSAARARGALSELEQQRAERAARRKSLMERRAAREKDMTEVRGELARQLRAAYFMGGNAPLQMVLNQDSAAGLDRSLVYYGYLGRHRVSQLARLNEDLAEIEELAARIDEEEAHLKQLAEQQQQRLGDLESAREKRGQVLASLDKQSRTLASRLADARRQQQELEDLLKQLSRKAPKSSSSQDRDSAFARLRGKLAWPVAGKVLVDFGESTIGNYRSTGIEIEASRGAPVRAIHDGVVEFADWRGLLGLVIVINHGDGYISVYGHNDQLYREQGARVSAGDLIGAAGDSGGWKTTGVQFELRRGSTPVDPHAWFSTKQPPAR